MLGRGGGGEAFRLAWHTGGVSSVNWSHSHPEMLCSAGVHQLVFWNLRIAAEHAMVSTRSLNPHPFRSRVASCHFSSHSPFDVVAAAVTGEIASIRIRNNLLRPTALSNVPHELRNLGSEVGSESLTLYPATALSNVPQMLEKLGAETDPDARILPRWIPRASR